MNEYEVVQTSFVRRVWQKLGFGTCILVPDEENPPEGLNDYVRTETMIHFDWRDRLRFMFSGKVWICHLIYVDTPVNKMSAVAKASILPPTTDVREEDRAEGMKIHEW